MKFATAWWGIQILAESDEDKDILQSLFDRLPEEADVSYENGFVCIASPEYAENGGFSEEQIKNAKLVIDFRR